MATNPIREYLTELIQLTGYTPQVSFDRLPDEARTLYNPRTKVINVGDDFSKSTLFRELGRAIEFEDMEIADASRSFRLARGDRGFIAPGIDIFAIGLAYFASAELMTELYAADPEHFQYTLGVIEMLKARR